MGKRTATWVSLFLVLAVMAAAGVYYLFGRGDGTPTPRQDVAQFAGEGHSMTDSFAVHEPWQIHWENEGSTFSYAIKGERDYGTVIEQEGPGSGVTSPVGSGTFYLEIVAEGPWQVQIFQNE